MNRLQRELHRLYAPQAFDAQATDPGEPGRVDAGGRVRAMVLQLARPADWATLAKVWQGVQVDLELPAPAIAVSGQDAYQLWFSLSQPVPALQATAFLESLRRRYLADIKPERVAMNPGLQASSAPPALEIWRVPALQEAGGRWSAFVAPDLAPVFADEPWLDTSPNPDGQATLLSRLESIQAADFERALERLRPVVTPAQPPPPSDPALPAAAGAGLMIMGSAPAGAWRDPKRFLLDVMNNDSVALGLRIEAAKALLPYFDEARPG